jgi:hypothetical protein
MSRRLWQCLSRAAGGVSDKHWHAVHHFTATVLERIIVSPDVRQPHSIDEDRFQVWFDACASGTTAWRFASKW